MKKRKKTDRALLFLLIIFTALTLFPLFIMISFSLRGRSLVFASILFPIEPTIDNYVTIFQDPLLMGQLRNSVVLSILVTMICVLVSIITGYGFSRFQFKFKLPLLYYTFATRMFPPILIAIGFFKVITRLNLYDNIFSLLLVNTATALPFSIWMVKNYFDKIPKSIDESAMIDGCSRIKACFLVIVPIGTPVFLAVGMWTFLSTWSEYLYANTFIVSTAKQMITTGIVTLLGHYVVNWGLVMAYAIVISAPILVLFVFLQKYFLGGLTEGGIK